jgi:SOS-response transcriptional repressor LexA
MQTLHTMCTLCVNTACTCAFTECLASTAMPNTPIERALTWAAEMQMNQSAFARAMGVSPQDVTNWKRRGMPPEHYAKAATVTNRSIDELLGRSRSQAPSVAEEIARYGPSNTEPGPDIREGPVPLISWVRAGDWNHAVDIFQPGEAERWLDCPVAHSASTYALRVRGDSMTAPTGNVRSYPEGCIIFVDPAKRSPVNGQRIIAKLDGSDDVTFKVFKNEDGRIWLQPLNPMHTPIHDRFWVLGTVIGKWEDE